MALSAVKKEPAKPKAGEAAPAAEGAPPAPAGKKGKNLLVIGLGVALLGAGGGGAWWYMHREPAGPEKHKAEPAKPPVFAPLDAFTVNLQQEDTAQFAQVGLTLRMVDEAAINELKVRMPEVRDRILLMLSAKKAVQLLSVEGKRKLAEEIRAAVNAILAPEAVQRIVLAKAAERAAAEAKRKPAPAPAERPEGQEAGEQGEVAEAAEAVVEAPRPAPVVLPVTGVLFTSFIVQ